MTGAPRISLKKPDGSLPSEAAPFSIFERKFGKFKGWVILAAGKFCEALRRLIEFVVLDAEEVGRISKVPKLRYITLA